MQKLTILLVLILTQSAFGQCRLLDFIPDTIQFGCATVYYYQIDSSVHITYRIDGFEQSFPDSYHLSCSNTYIPSVWTPQWHNEHYIGFNSGCGTSCFATLLAPLKPGLPFKRGGQVLFDTTNSIYFSIYRDTVTWEPYLEIQNFNTDKIQHYPLNSMDFWGATPLDKLSCKTAHPKGFIYKNGLLTLYVTDQEGTPVSRNFNVKP